MGAGLTRRRWAWTLVGRRSGGATVMYARGRCRGPPLVEFVPWCGWPTGPACQQCEHRLCAIHATRCCRTTECAFVPPGGVQTEVQSVTAVRKLKAQQPYSSWYASQPNGANKAVQQYRTRAISTEEYNPHRRSVPYQTKTTWLNASGPQKQCLCNTVVASAYILQQPNSCVWATGKKGQQGGMQSSSDAAVLAVQVKIWRNN